MSCFEAKLFPVIRELRIGDGAACRAFKKARTAYYNISKISPLDLYSCNRCSSPGHAIPGWCGGCNQPENERLKGVYTVTGRNEVGNTGGVKVFLESDDVQLCVVSFPGWSFFSLLSAVVEDVELELDGWRDENRHSVITSARQLSTPHPQQQALNMGE